MDSISMTRDFRAFVWFVVGVAMAFVILVSPVSAAQVRLQMPSNIGGTSAARVTAGPVGAVNDSVFSSGMTTSVGGKVVTVPAAWRFAANAGQFALDTVRISPAGLITTAVAAFLLPYGLEYLNDAWVSQGGSVDPVGSVAALYWVAYGYSACNNGQYATANACANAVAARTDGEAPRDVGGGYWSVDYYAHPFNNVLVQPQCPGGSSRGTGGAYCVPDLVTCPAGTTLNGGLCIGQARPAELTDWDSVYAQPVPDWMLKHMADQGFGVPVEAPVPDPAPIKAPLSDPYPLPDGSTARDVVQVTPQPSNPEWADVRYIQEPVTTPDGQPVGEENPGPTPEEKTDLCKEHPEIIACQEMGEAEDSDLETDSHDISITEQGGWGAGNASCPADLSTTLQSGGGLQVGFSWQPVCQAATALRPLVIGMAWLSAVLVAVGIGRRAQS